MWQIEYYVEPNGHQPVADWLDSLATTEEANLRDKIARLEQHGLLLLRTKMMSTLGGYGAGFYELKYGAYRIALFHDRDSNSFVLLHGFRKQRMREKLEVRTAGTRLLEYTRRKDHGEEDDTRRPGGTAA